MSDESDDEQIVHGRWQGVGYDLDLQYSDLADILERYPLKARSSTSTNTVRTTPKKYKYPPEEWDHKADRPVYHEGCFINSDLFQQGKDYVGVNIDTSVHGRKRHNHQVYFGSVAEAQAYHRSLPKIPSELSDVRAAVIREREEKKKSCSDALALQDDPSPSAQNKRKWSMGDVARITLAVEREGAGQWNAKAAALFQDARSGTELSNLYHSTIKEHLTAPTSRPLKVRRKIVPPKREKRKSAPAVARAACNDTAPQPSRFKGVHWNRTAGGWTAKCGTREVPADTEVEAAEEYDKFCTTGCPNFLSHNEIDEGHVRVIADGVVGFFGIYRFASGPGLAPPQLPHSILPDHAWDFTKELDWEDRMRFHAPGGVNRSGRRVKIDGILIATTRGERYARFDGYIDRSSTIPVDVDVF